MEKTVVLIYGSPTQGYGKERRRDIHTIKRIYAPLSIMYLAATLQEAAIPVILFDQRLTPVDEILARIREEASILFVGFSTMTGSQITNSLAVAQSLRDALGKGIPFVWGGIHPTLYPAKTILDPLVDIICYGEGDYTVVDLAKTLNSGSNLATVSGIVYKVNGEVHTNPARPKIKELGKLPMPAWNQFKEFLNPAQYPLLATISTSRGCPYNCTYCYKWGVDVIGEGASWRPFSAERVIQEVDYLHDNFGFDLFETADENFILKPERAISIIRAFKERKLRVAAIRSNVHTYSDAIIGELEGFCDYVGYSPETASPHIQKILNKEASYDDMRTLNSKLRDIGIVTVHNFIFGFPFETDDDIAAIVKLCTSFKKINPAARMSLYQYMPYPGAPLTDMMVEKYGLVLPETFAEWGQSDMYGELSLRFRPWIDEAKVDFLNKFQLLFNTVFNTYQPFDAATEALYNSHPKLKQIMGDLGSIPRATVSPIKPTLNKRLTDDLLDRFKDRLFI